MLSVFLALEEQSGLNRVIAKLVGEIKFVQLELSLNLIEKIMESSSGNHQRMFIILKFMNLKEKE